MPETLHRKRRAKGTKPEPGDYSLHARGKGLPVMKCACCGEYMPIRSNLAVAEEAYRLTSYLDSSSEPACPNEACDKHGILMSEDPSNYAQYGKTAAGTPRWRCNACRKTFTLGGKSTRRQRKTHKNRDVFVLLMNKTPLKRMVEITGLAKQTLYDKVDFVHRQCMAFVSERETNLLEGHGLPKMYVAVDRQSFIVNWSSRKDRRNVQLNAVASADLKSGYVFGMNLNFDGSLDPDEVERDALSIGDYTLAGPFRRYARLWLKRDYAEAVAASAALAAVKKAKALAKARGADELVAEINAEYEAAGVREDIEESDDKDKEIALPKLGMQVHEQYTLYAHLLILNRLLTSSPKVRVYMDQDSGMRAAFMTAFHKRIQERTADGFYVQVLKKSTIDEKDKAAARSRAAFKAMADAHPGLTPFEVEVLMVKNEMKRMAAFGHWGDRWLTHPLPNKSEPDKRICWLTDLGDYDEDHAARLYLKASLHSVDRFFMLARRRLSLAERGVPTASTDRRIWHGYSAYKPQNLARVLEIFRVFYNYCLKGQDGKTPAMRLGLARGPVDPQDVLYF